MGKLTEEFIRNAIEVQSQWDKMNDYLYEMCAGMASQAGALDIMGRLHIIGRTYSASLERRRRQKESANGSSNKKHLTTDELYWVVANEISVSKIGQEIDRINSTHGDSRELALRVHNRLIKIFQNYTRENKRLLASKYLHFHCRDSIYIFDRRAEKSVSKLCECHKCRIEKKVYESADQKYADFCCKCDALNEIIYFLIGKRLDTRSLDKVLVHWCDTCGEKAR